MDLCIFPKSANIIHSQSAIWQSAIIPRHDPFPNSIPFHSSIRPFQQSPQAIFSPIPASHLCLHSSEPARYFNTVPFQYSIITSPFQQYRGLMLDDCLRTWLLFLIFVCGRGDHSRTWFVFRDICLAPWLFFRRLGCCLEDLAVGTI